MKKLWCVWRNLDWTLKFLYVAFPWVIINEVIRVSQESCFSDAIKTNGALIIMFTIMVIMTANPHEN